MPSEVSCVKRTYEIWVQTWHNYHRSIDCPWLGPVVGIVLADGLMPTRHQDIRNDYYDDVGRLVHMKGPFYYHGL